VIERLDPFDLPEYGAARLAIGPAAPKIRKNEDSPGDARPGPVMRQRKSKPPPPK
jgi:hypothetical protein